MKGFLEYARSQSPDFSKQLEDAGGYDAALKGTRDFENAWKKAGEEPAFETLQHEYIASKNYVPLVDKITKDTGLDVDNRSAALKDVVWSVAVQHGPGSSVISTALNDKDASKMSDAEIIDAIYDERSAVIKNKEGKDVLKYFKKSTENVQDGVKERFNQERVCAKRMLEAENRRQSTDFNALSPRLP